jgi:hypothetical protein
VIIVDKNKNPDIKQEAKAINGDAAEPKLEMNLKTMFQYE